MPLPKIAVFIFAILFVRGCESKIAVQQVNNNKPGETMPANGIIYALPNTVLRVGMKIDQATTAPPLYGRYSAIFAPDEDSFCKKDNTGLTDPCWDKPKLAYSVQPGATFTTYGEPDPTNVFLVKFTKSGRIDQSLSMTWNEVGLMTAANAQVTNRTGDLVLSGLKMATSLGIKALALGAVGFDGSGIAKPENCGVDNDSKTDEWVINILWAANIDDVRKRLVQNYCMIDKSERDKWGNGTAPVTVKDPQTGVAKNRKLFDLAPPQPESKPQTQPQPKSTPMPTPTPVPALLRDYTYRDLLADALSDFMDKIYPAVLAQNKLLHNDGNPLNPTAALSIVQDELNKQMAALFLGTKKTTTWDALFDVRRLSGTPVPDKPAPLPSTLNLLGFDPKMGVCLGIDSELAPVSLRPPDKFIFSEKCGARPASNFVLDLKYFPASSSQLFTQVHDDKTGERSFRYRLPAQVTAVLSREVQPDPAHPGDPKTTPWAAANFSVAQLGIVISLPATHHSKTLSYDLGLIEATGGLKTFKLGTTNGLDASTIDALSGIGGSILDARNKSAEDLNQLTRQDQLLKLKDDICTIQKKYNITCTNPPQ